MESNDKNIKSEKEIFYDKIANDIKNTVWGDLNNSDSENLKLKNTIKELNEDIVKYERIFSIILDTIKDINSMSASTSASPHDIERIGENILSELEKLRNSIRTIEDRNNRLLDENRLLKLRDTEYIKNLIIDSLKSIPGFGSIAPLLDRFGIISEISLTIVRYHIFYIIYNICAIFLVLYYIEFIIDSTLYCTIVYK